jgi:hypothetical protein
VARMTDVAIVRAWVLHVFILANIASVLLEMRMPLV